MVTNKIHHRNNTLIKIKYVYLSHNSRPMGRPKVNDRLIQVPVPVRQSELERYGRTVIIQVLKDQLNNFITKIQN